MDQGKESLAEELARLRRLIVARNKTTLVGAMMGSFIHDLNNPLTAVNGNIELLQLSPVTEDAKVKKRLDTIQTGTKRLSEKLRAVQLFTKSGRADSMIDVVEVVRDTARAAEYLPKTIRLPINVEISGEPLMVSGNSNQIAQALLALVDNALDAVAQTTGPNVTISVTRQTDGGVVISVRNNGPEISAEVGQLMFEPFFTTKPDAAGVGLMIASQFIAENQGQLSWHSSATQTEFIITLKR